MHHIKSILEHKNSSLLYANIDIYTKVFVLHQPKFYYWVDIIIIIIFLSGMSSWLIAQHWTLFKLVYEDTNGYLFSFYKMNFEHICFHNALTTNFATNWLIKLDAFFSKLGAQTTVNENVGGGVNDEQKLTQAKRKN